MDIKNESAKMARNRKEIPFRAKAIETYEFIGNLFANCIRRFDPKTIIATTVILAINLE